MSDKGAGDSFDAIIIGSGVIGCAISLALSRKGYRTLNVDRLPAAGYGSTSSSAGIIRPYYSTVEGTALAYESHFYWQSWREFLRAEAAETLAQYIQCGCLVLMTPGSDRLATTQQVLSSVGVPFEVVEPEKLKAMLPPIDLQSFAPPKRIDDPAFGQPNQSNLEGAIFTPTGGFINDPQLACRNLQEASKLLGASFRFNVDVSEIRQAGGKVTGVTLNGSARVDAPVVINVAGPHSSNVNKLAGVEAAMSIKTRPLRQEVVHVPFPEQFDFGANGFIVTDGDAGIYMRPEVGNHMLIGSLEPSCDTLDWADPDTFNPSLTDQSTNQVWRAAQRFPSLAIPNRTQGLAALYDVSSDWIPIYDRSDLPGYFMAIGTSGNQFKNAPIVGEMMAELVAFCGAGHDHDATPMSFHLKHLNRDLSMKFFSRKRPVHSESSFSVLG
jgi:sarcosine oxidase, subunit beta